MDGRGVARARAGRMRRRRRPAARAGGPAVPADDRLQHGVHRRFGVGRAREGAARHDEDDVPDDLPRVAGARHHGHRAADAGHRARERGRRHAGRRDGAADGEAEPVHVPDAEREPRPEPARAAVPRRRRAGRRDPRRDDPVRRCDRRRQDHEDDVSVLPVHQLLVAGNRPDEDRWHVQPARLSPGAIAELPAGGARPAGDDQRGRQLYGNRQLRQEERRTAAGVERDREPAVHAAPRCAGIPVAQLPAADSADARRARSGEGRQGDSDRRQAAQPARAGFHPHWRRERGPHARSSERGRRIGHLVPEPADGGRAGLAGRRVHRRRQRIQRPRDRARRRAGHAARSVQRVAGRAHARAEPRLHAEGAGCRDDRACRCGIGAGDRQVRVHRRRVRVPRHGRYEQPVLHGRRVRAGTACGWRHGGAAREGAAPRQNEGETS